jgi:hypothetical protein
MSCRAVNRIGLEFVAFDTRLAYNPCRPTPFKDIRSRILVRLLRVPSQSLDINYVADVVPGSKSLMALPVGFAQSF